MPTTTEYYWAQQNAQINAQATPTTPQPTEQKVPTRKPVWWTPVPTLKPTYSPTQDQCRGAPCDYEGGKICIYTLLRSLDAISIESSYI